MLTKSDPFKTATCNDNKCKACTTNPKLNCKTRGVEYKMKCQGCINDEEQERVIHWGNSEKSKGKSL